MNISPENGFASAEDGHLSSSLGCLLPEDSDFTEFTKSAPCSEFDNEDLQDKKEEEKEEEELNQDVSATNRNSSPTPNQPSYKFVTPKDFELLTVIGVGSFGR
jgi:hypothetical protein